MTNLKQLKDLTDKDKREMGQHYFEQFKPFINELTTAASSIIQNKDTLAVYFLLDIIRGVLKHIVDKICNDENKDINFDDYICGWKKE